MWTFDKPPDVQTIKKTIPNAKAEEVVGLFYDHVKEFNNYQYSDSQKIDGETATYVHTLYNIQPPKDNRLEVIDIRYPEVKRGEVSIPKYFKPLIIQAWRIQDNCLVEVEYSPFFESIVRDLISQFKQIDPVPPETIKAESTEAGGTLENIWSILDKLQFVDSTGWDRPLITLWNQNKDNNAIAKAASTLTGTKVTKERVTRRITELRNIFGEHKKTILPYRRADYKSGKAQRKKLRI